MTQHRWSREPAAWAVRTRDLTKRFRSTTAVAGLDLNVPLGGVHALLGPNGSGKTTTIRLLLGLLRPNGGAMELFGVPVPERLPEVIGRVGAIVETPSFYPTMTLRRNLEILATSIGAPTRRVTEVLLEVGLGGRAETRFNQCSLGMKQRLAIAATLLKEPELFIFDEPTNGLDPAGIQEIRTTMRALADSGRTVLVSSHLLSEIQQIADTVSIIGRGRVLAEGELGQFLADGGAHVVVEVADQGSAFEALRVAGFTPQIVGGQLHVTRRDQTAPDPAEVAQVLGHADVWPRHLSLESHSLEQVFLGLTANEHLTATQGRPQAVAS